MLDLSAYFARIGFQGTPRADLATLQAIHALHPAVMAFENMDVLLGHGIDIQLEKVCDKLITRQRGGYCFEQNGLLLEVLRQLGFDPQPLMARVVWQLAADAPAGPKTHLVLRVTIDGQAWLADVGFGGLVLPAPLRFVSGEPQPTAHETFRLTAQEHGYLLEVELSGEWQPVYQLSNEPLQPIDLEVANWFTSAHPNSKFRHNLMAARVTPDARYSLLNNRLSVRAPGADVVRRELSLAELEQVLADDFLLPVDASWREVLRRFTT